MRILLFLSLAACGGVAAENARGNDPKSERISVKNRFELGNGLSVVLQENHSAPVVAVQAWVRAGTADEDAGEEGAAHLLEHTLVDAEMSRKIEALGGTLSTRVGHDYSWVQAVVARRDFQTGADLIAQAVFAPTLKDVDVERELAAARDELRRAALTPARRVSSALFESIYTEHPYKRSLLGTDEGLRQLSRAKLAHFHGRYFTPANTVLVITGDVTLQEARAIVGRSFKGAAQKLQAKPKRPTEPVQKTARTKVMEFPTTDAYVSTAWPIPGLDHPDATALTLLAVVLGEGHGSRLAERLTKDGGLASDVYAFAYTPNGPGFLTIGFVAQPKSAQESTLTLLAEADRVRREVVSEAELRRAKAIVLGDTYRDKQTAEGRASKTGFYQAMLGDASIEDRFGLDIEKVSVADLKRVAAKYLGSSTLNLVALVPKGGKDSVRSEELVARAKALDATFATRDDVLLPPPGPLSVYRVKLPSGTTVLLQPDRTVPSVSVRAAFIGGQRYEDKSTNGINALLARLIPRATEKHNAKQVVELKEELAATIEGFSTQNAFGLYGEFLKSTADEGLDLMAEMLFLPRFNPEEIDRERAVLLAEIRSREDHPPSAVFDLLTEHLYDVHPYRLRQKGSVDAVSALREPELQRFFKRLYTRDKLVLALVGDFQPDEMLAQLSRLFGALKERGETPKPPAAELALEKPRSIERNKDRSQAYAVLGFRGAALGDKDRYALELLSTILGGEGGRLSKALKDKLATNVASVSVEGLEPGYFAAYLSTSPERLDAAVDALKKELSALQQAPVGKDELERARHYMLGSHAIGLQSASARAASLALNELFGNGFDEDATFDDQVGHVSAADVQRVAKDYLDLSRSVLAVIKPGKK